jgi:hypothetical protein
VVIGGVYQEKGISIAFGVIRELAIVLAGKGLQFQACGLDAMGMGFHENEGMRADIGKDGNGTCGYGQDGDQQPSPAGLPGQPGVLVK